MPDLTSLVSVLGATVQPSPAPESTPLLYVLISVIGGGTIVPLAYKLIERWKSRAADTKRAATQIEDIASHAAREAVEATRGALTILREQLKDRGEECTMLRNQHERDLAQHRDDVEEIVRLRGELRAGGG